MRGVLGGVAGTGMNRYCRARGGGRMSVNCRGSRRGAERFHHWGPKIDLERA